MCWQLMNSRWRRIWLCLHRVHPAVGISSGLCAEPCGGLAVVKASAVRGRYPAIGNGTLVVDVVVNKYVDVDDTVSIDVDVEVSVCGTTVQPMLLISCSPSRL